MSSPGLSPDEERERSILIVEARDPAVVHPPTDLQGEPWQSRYIFNPNQPWPPVLATRFFPPPPWPENLEGDNLTIMPVVGPFLALTPEQMETPPGFGRFVHGEFSEHLFEEHPYRLRERRREAREDRREERRDERREEREERREDRIDEREDRRERRARGRRRGHDRGPIDGPGASPLSADTTERPTMDWPSGGGGE